MAITPTSTKSKQYQALGIDEIATDIETVFSAVSELQDNPSGGLNYKSLVTKITQSGTSAPVNSVVFSNELTNVSWSRVQAGIYSLTFTEWVDNKVYISGVTEWSGNGNTTFPIWDESAIIGYYQIYISPSSNSIGLEIFNSSFVRVDMVDLIGELYFPEIKVFN